MNFNTDCKRHASISRDMCLEFALRFPTDIIENIFEHRRNISRTPLARHPWACGRGSYERSTTFVLFIFLLFPPPGFRRGGGKNVPPVTGKGRLRAERVVLSTGGRGRETVAEI